MAALSQVLKTTHNCLRQPWVTVCLSCQNSFKQPLPLLSLSTRNVNPCVGYLALRVIFILYLCNGYALCSFINVLFQTGGLKKHTKWHFPPSQHRWVKRETHRWAIPPQTTTVLSSTGKGSHVWVMRLMCLRNGTEHNTGSLCELKQIAHSPHSLMKTTMITQLFPQIRADF